MYDSYDNLYELIQSNSTDLNFIKLGQEHREKPGTTCQ